MMKENPISTIRKAIKGAAEQTSSAENIEIPEERHYKETFEFFRNLKILEPEMYEKLIEIGAKGKELSDELGYDLHKRLVGILKQISIKNKYLLDQEIDKIKHTKNLSPEQLEKELNRVKDEHINNIVINEVLNDSCLKSAFAEKEQLLKKVIDFLKYASSEFSKFD